MRIARLRGSELSPNPEPQKQNDLPSAGHTAGPWMSLTLTLYMAMRRVPYDCIQFYRMCPFVH